jgi:cytoskeleton protein RodZ
MLLSEEKNSRRIVLFACCNTDEFPRIDMPTFGQDLKAAREAKGVTLDAIAQDTKVGLRHLQALEADRFDQLPGGVFNRGIVRNYLQFLHLDQADQAEWMERFSQLPGSSAATAKESDWPRQSQLIPGIQPGPPGQEDVRFRWLGVLLLFLLLAAAGWFTYLFAAKHWRRASAPPPTSSRQSCIIAACLS